MAAVTGAEIARSDYPNLRLIQLERLRKRRACTMRMSQRANHRDVVAPVRAVIPLRNDRGWLQRRMMFSGTCRDVFNHDIGFCKALVRIAAHLGWRDVERRPVEFVVPLLGRGGFHALDVIEDRREDFEIDGDHARCFVGNVIGGGRHDRDWGTDLKYLFVENEAVRRTAADAHVLVNVRQIAAMEYGDHTRYGFGLASVDRGDARVRVRTTQGAHEQHAGLGHVLAVLTEPRSEEHTSELQS